VHILEILYTIIFLLAFRYVGFLQVKNLHKWIMPASYSLKILIGILFLVIYLHPDTNNAVPSDAMRFMSESKQLHDIAKKSPSDYLTLVSGIGEDKALIKKYLSKTFLWDSSSKSVVNDSRNMIRLHSIIHFFSHGSPYIHMLFMCFFALIGLRNIFISLLPFVALKPIIFFVALLIIPSTLFWTSGILKEPIVLFGVGLLLRAFLIKETFLKRIVYGIIASFILVNIKPYVIACIALGTCFFILYKFVFKQKIILSIICFFIILISVALLFNGRTQKVVSYLSMKQFHFDHIGKGGLFVANENDDLFYFELYQYKNLKINNQDSTVELIHPTKSMKIFRRNRYPSTPCFLYPNHQKWKIHYQVPGAISYIKTTPINKSIFQLIKNIPEALVNSYARPFPKDPGSSLRFPAMFEVWILSLLLLFSFLNRRSLNKDQMGMIISLSIFTISLLLIIGWTTPVIGAIFRYRFPALLALILVSLIIIKPKEIKIQ